MQWRLGIDLGTNSLGFAVLRLDKDYEPDALLDWGTRIFSDGREPKTGVSLAVARRMARGMRRNRDRRNARVRAFADCLKRFGLPLDTSICPYEARHLAVTQEVSPKILIRALFHMSQHRGFKSNRKIDSQEKEMSELKKSMSHLRNYLSERKIFLGQFLYERHKKGASTRFREGAFGVSIDYRDEIHIVYPDRAMYFDEFKAIVLRQGTNIFTEDQWNELEHLLFFQRPLKPQQVGLCEFEDEKRASKSLPIAHKIRILQEVNNLRYHNAGKACCLKDEHRLKLIAALEIKNQTFKQIKKMLGFSDEVFFNLEESRDKLEGNETSVKMAKVFKEYGIDWHVFSLSMQNSIVQNILDCDDSDDALKALQEQNDVHDWGFSKDALDRLMDISFPSAFARLSVMAMEKIIPKLEEGKLFWEAATEIYGGHTHLRSQTGEVLESLPYYGEVLPKSTSPIRKTLLANKDEEKYGRIGNPTVHVALNQLRQVVNALIEKYGNPYQIHIELARELKLSKKEKERMHKENNELKKANDRRKEELATCNISDPSREDLIKMRLWEELAPHGDGMGRMDIYTGKIIPLADCMSENVEIEHILPFARTYDNTMANKTITFRWVNKEKGNRTPAEYALIKEAEIHEQMMERASRLKKSKRWRFEKDAMDIYERATFGQLQKSELHEHFEKGDQTAFLARQLKDTQYMSVIASRYLIPIVGAPQRVIPVKGSMTALLRAKWKLNFAKQKNTEEERSDHRHHAVDALIIALTSKSFIKRIAEYTQEKQEANETYTAKLFVPRPALLEGAAMIRLREMYDDIHVSHKPNHTLEGALYAETAYGIIDEDHPDFERGNGVCRRPITALKETELEKIRDITLRNIIKQRLKELEAQGFNKWEEKLGCIFKEGIILGQHRQKIRSVRILIKNQSMQAIPSAPKAYAVGEYAFCDIWKVPKMNKQRKFIGKFEYKASFVNYADAQRFKDDQAKLFKKYKPHPAAKHCMRLFKDDMVVWIKQENGQDKEELSRVAGFSTTNNKLDFRPHTQAGKTKENFISINTLMGKCLMRKVRISVDGRLIL